MYDKKLNHTTHMIIQQIINKPSYTIVYSSSFT